MKGRIVRQFLIPAAALALALPANAATLFFDDFEAEGPPNTLNYTGFANWTVTGQVDLVGMPNGFGITCAGNCVDLDGSSGPGEIHTKNPIAFAAGLPVRIQFDLSGNQRSRGEDWFNFSIWFDPPVDHGGYSYLLPPGKSGTRPARPNILAITYLQAIPGTMAFGTWHLTFLPLKAGTLNLRFGTSSADNIGPLLDNVLVTQVPEPATWAMLIAGFGLVGAAARRRRPAHA